MCLFVNSAHQTFNRYNSVFAHISQDILSDFDELSDWRMRSLPTDLHAQQNALLMRVSCHNRRHCWPLLLDPDNQAEMWVKALQGSRNTFNLCDVAVEEDRGDC